MKRTWDLGDEGVGTQVRNERRGVGVVAQKGTCE